MNPFKARFLACLVLLIPPALQAQEIPDNDHVFELQYGAHFAVLHDDAFSVFNQSGSAPFNIGAKYRHEHEKRFFYTDFLFDSYKLKGYEPFSFTRWNDKPSTADLSYHSAIRINFKWSLMHEPFEVGILNANSFVSSNWVFGSTGTYGYFGMYGVGSYLTYRYQHKDKWTASASLNLPLFAWVAHSPYAANDDEYIYNNRKHNGLHSFLSMTVDGRFATLNRLQQFDIVLDGKYLINDEWAVGLNYQFSFLNYRDHGNYRLAQNMISIVGSYRLIR